MDNGRTSKRIERREICGFSALILRKRQKNMYLSVRPDGTLRVSCPSFLSDAEIKGFVASHAQWIDGRRLKSFDRPPDDGETFFLWGKTLTLKVLAERPWGVTADGENLLLRAPEGSTPKERRALLEAFFRAQLCAALPPLLGQWQSALNVSPSGWRVRDMTGRWGSCSAKTRRLCFNTRLANRDKRCLEYVVVHELCHLLVPNHSRKFWDGVASCLPDWKERRKLLRVPCPESASDENGAGQTHPEQRGDHAQQR
ncbi:MAG: M48 family metallopeptidase [Pyramidobacter sp.]|jgi:predicted metal-dependent hydrolase